MAKTITYTSVDGSVAKYQINSENECFPRVRPRIEAGNGQILFIDEGKTIPITAATDTVNINGTAYSPGFNISTVGAEISKVYGSNFLTA